MKSLVHVLFMLFIGSIIDDKIVGGTSANGYVKLDTSDNNNSSTILKNSTCHPENFDNGQSCTMNCTVSCTGKVADVKPGWIYTAYENSSEAYPIVDDVGFKYSFENLTLTLGLTDYRSGFYVAQFSCIDRQLNCSLSITNGTGVAMGGACSSSRNCTALNAACDTTGKCTCPNEYPYPMTNSPTTSACLPVAAMGSKCMVDSQCQDEESELTCRKNEGSDFGICSCKDHSYFVRYVDEKGKMMCIEPEGYHDECDYDEECNFIDPFMECDSEGYCDCEYGYYYDDFYQACFYNPWTTYLSVTAVIGIVFGVIFLVILIMVAFAMCLRPKRLNRPPVPPTTIDNQFSSFTEPTVTWSAGQQPAYPMDGLPNYDEAGRLDSSPPPFESDIVIKTRLEDPPVENLCSNPFRQEEPYEQQPQQQQWFVQQDTPQPIPSQMIQHQRLNTSPSATEQLNSNEMFFFENPNHQTNLAFEEDC